MKDERELVCVWCMEKLLCSQLHPNLGFKKHGNGIHPPICILFKCVS
jgi:hypothetical protein